MIKINTDDLASYRFSRKEVKKGCEEYDKLVIEAQKALKNKPPLRKNMERKIVYRDD